MLGQPMVLLALLAFFAGLTVLVAVVLGVLTKASRPGEQMRRRLAAYTIGLPKVRQAEPGSDGPGARPSDGGPPEPADGADVPPWGSPPDLPAGSTPGSGLSKTAVGRSAVNLAERLVATRDLDTAMAGRLEEAAIPMRTAEWMLLHVAAAVGAALLLLLLSGGAIPATLLGLIIGLVAPWLVLSVRAGRRRSAFLAQLPDTLQLLASSLKAGHSLPQAIDTVVRQGEAPVAAEFNRALIENRLGVPMEDALERVGDRLHSDDFSWVVMAIRIQREVGGNLAELLMTVAETLRERERLRRQVQVLSAEGRLSGIILGLLPVGFAAYLMLTRPEYLRPMASPFGMVMSIAAVVLLLVGGIWVAKIVRVEV